MAVLCAVLAVSGCGKRRLDLGKVETESTLDGGGGGADAGASFRDGGGGGRVHPCDPNAEHPDAECARYNEVCVRETGRCGECTAETESSQCGRSRFGPQQKRCDTTTNLCEDCIDDSDCADSFFPVCNKRGHFCTNACTSNGCFFNLFGVCEQALCALCSSDSDCTTLQNPVFRFGARCRAGDCVECVTDEDCTSAFRPHCGPHGDCVD